MPGHDALLIERVEEIADFLHLNVSDVMERLSHGFGYQHAAVAEDFRRAAPQTDDDLLAWYRSTDAYIWELTAYHLDVGFNYTGMIEGVAGHLPKESSVLCLGDGIGDLSLALIDAGHLVAYHDLSGSRTAEFACFRFDRSFQAGGAPGTLQAVGLLMSTDFSPPDLHRRRPDAILALDFFEHVPNVEEWARFVFTVLRPGGKMLAQNAFNMGSGPDGSIPMHLVTNNHYEKDWDSLLDSIGFLPPVGGWREKP